MIQPPSCAEDTVQNYQRSPIPPELSPSVSPPARRRGHPQTEARPTPLCKPVVNPDRPDRVEPRVLRLHRVRHRRLLRASACAGRLHRLPADSAAYRRQDLSRPGRSGPLKRREEKTRPSTRVAHSGAATCGLGPSTPQSRSDSRLARKWLALSGPRKPFTGPDPAKPNG